MQMNWKVMVSSGNRKHVSRSMMIESKDIIMKERNGTAVSLNKNISEVSQTQL